MTHRVSHQVLFSREFLTAQIANIRKLTSVNSFVISEVMSVQKLLPASFTRVLAIARVFFLIVLVQRAFVSAVFPANLAFVRIVDGVSGLVQLQVLLAHELLGTDGAGKGAVPGVEAEVVGEVLALAEPLAAKVAGVGAGQVGVALGGGVGQFVRLEVGADGEVQVAHAAHLGVGGVFGGCNRRKTVFCIYRFCKFVRFYRANTSSCALNA